MSTMSFNGLSPAEAERLALLIEDCAEVSHAATKILRHGFESYNPLVPVSLTNREELETELGHLMISLKLLFDNADVSEERIEDAMRTKAATIERWLHHNQLKKD